MVVSSWDGSRAWLCLWGGVSSPMPSAPRVVSSSWECWRSRGMSLIQLGRLEVQGDEPHPCRAMGQLGQAEEALW